LPPTHPPHLLIPAGATRLSQAQASARLNEQQQLSFNVEFVPAEGHRQSGYVRASGTVPLADADVATATVSSRAGEPAQQQQQLDVRLSVKDSGMAILTSVTPDVHWQQGQASIDLRLRGSLMQPVLSGGASISKATLDCPLLRFPLTNVSAEVRAGEDLLTVESLEARCGRRGFARARGSLPVYAAAGSSSQHRLVAEASGLELRLRNMYSGQYDASLLVTSSLANPTVAGSMLFSKGIVFIVPQGGPGAPHFAAIA
jgi:translocation and assembly module TamB